MRDCTCVGSCRGAEGLGLGWNCVVANGSVEDARIGAPSAPIERPESGGHRSDYSRPLAVTIEHDALVIRIGIQTLAHAVTYSDWANPYDEESGDYFREFAITDVKQFALDVASMMREEEEDGSSRLSNFIDRASEAAINDGSLGLHEDYNHRIKHGETSPLETWATDGNQPATQSSGRSRGSEAQEKETPTPETK